MSEKTFKSRLVQKHDTEANWLKATNFIPKQGEIIIYDIDTTYNYERMKIGDGTTVVSSLPFTTATVLADAKLYIPMGQLVDVSKELERIQKELEKARKNLAGIEGKLSNENFTARAPENVVQAEREKAAKARDLISQLEESEAALLKL